MTVNWTIQNDPDNDILETAGSVTFEPGQVEKDLELKVRGDTTPELDEVFMIQLSSTSLVRSPP